MFPCTENEPAESRPWPAIAKDLPLSPVLLWVIWMLCMFHGIHEPHSLYPQDHASVEEEEAVNASRPPPPPPLDRLEH